jgi:hypothetical protein
MAQMIGLAVVGERGNIKRELEGNFAPISAIAYEVGKDKLPWLTSIDEYSTTYINEMQAVHVIRELESIADNVPLEHQPTLRMLIKELRNLPVHNLVAFYGD